MKTYEQEKEIFTRQMNPYTENALRLMIKRRMQTKVTETRIRLYASITETETAYFWELRNDKNRHFWFKRIQPDVFLTIKNRLDREYRFTWYPIRQESPKAAKVAEYEYYI
jgi:hypothetical protein